MAVATVSKKGQITLPSSLRKKLGIHVHDRVSIEGDDRAIVIRPAPDILAFKGFLGKGMGLARARKLMERGVAAHVLGDKR